MSNNRFTGVKYFVDTLGINVENVFAAFSFYSGNNFDNIVYPEKWATNSASGLYTGPSSFYDYPGTGYFNGQNFFKLNKNLNFDNTTIFLSYQKLRSQDEILLSSAQGNNFNNYSGFCLGVNNANKLYFKYWNPVEGVFTFTYNKIIADKNLIILNRNGSVFSIGSYNTNSLQFEMEEFNIFQNSFANSNSLYVGGTPEINNVNWLFNSFNFSGYIDKLYIFDNEDVLIYKNSLVSGLFINVTGAEGELIKDCYLTGTSINSGFLYSQITGTLISGFQSGSIGITGYTISGSGYSYSGITGYLDVYIGQRIDNCGVSYDIIEKQPLSGLITNTININVPLIGTILSTGYIEIPLSGLISGNVLIPQTGEVCNEIFNVTGNVQYIVDENYLKSLSYNEITLFYPNTDNQNITEVYLEPYKNETLIYNRNLLYDSLYENFFFIDKEYKQNEILLFANGQTLIDGGYKLIPSGYNIIRRPEIDYFLTGTTVETEKFFITEDNLFYDYFSGKFYWNKNTGRFINIPNNLGNNYWVFQNGQKLIKNKDFTTLGLSCELLNVNNPNEENYIIFREIPNNFIYISGNSGYVRLSSPFNHGCSQVYYNGVKQKINNNYIENANLDLIFNNYYEFSNLEELIYNNSDDFFV
jgi:hypothetical protein